MLCPLSICRFVPFPDLGLNSGRVVDAAYSFLPAEPNAMFDWIPSHLETWAQTGGAGGRTSNPL